MIVRLFWTFNLIPHAQLLTHNHSYHFSSCVNESDLNLCIDYKMTFYLNLCIDYKMTPARIPVEKWYDGYKSTIEHWGIKLKVQNKHSINLYSVFYFFSSTFSRSNTGNIFSQRTFFFKSMRMGFSFFVIFIPSNFFLLFIDWYFYCVQDFRHNEIHAWKPILIFFSLGR